MLKINKLVLTAEMTWGETATTQVEGNKTA